MMKSFPTSCAAGLACLMLLASAGAAAQTQVYRYVDQEGRVVYSDKPPPPNARNPQTKRIGRNSIETSQLSFATQQAQERYPVTLYSFACGVVCDTAEGLLNKRGVPHAVIDVSQGDGADKLKRLTNGLEAPALQVGDQVATGFNESKWQSMLTDAGYPKTPPPRTTPITRPVPAATTADAGKPAPAVTPPEAEATPKGSYPQ
ncbi:MAG TPA: glutaredoxin family protein [Casimicrobiaceae bacterium]|nr:glutaredoxin family protein [Casimicrobiaceae bacterium]